MPRLVQMAKRRVNGEESGRERQQASSTLIQYKHEQSQEEEEEVLADWTDPDDFCAGSRDPTSAWHLTKKSYQGGKNKKVANRLMGGNLRIYLNDDPAVVARHREEHLRLKEERWLLPSSSTSSSSPSSSGVCQPSKQRRSPASRASAPQCWRAKPTRCAIVTL